MEVSKGERLYIGIFGNVNSGKSSLMNMITGQNYSIVSAVSGTTTDAVQKNMELAGVGPVVFIDTAGFDDKTQLAEKRLAKTYEALSRCDLAVAVISKDEVIEKGIGEILKTEGFEKIAASGKPVVLVISKVETDAEEEKLRSLTNLYKGDSLVFNGDNLVFVDSVNGRKKTELLDKISKSFPASISEKSLTEPFCKSGENVLLVMPQDSQAPKGRLILPQVQTIRDLLDRKVIIHCCTNETFLQNLDSLNQPPDLIITDSQFFPFVQKNKPAPSRLTSFSILQAASKGNLELFINGAKTIKQLTNTSRVLIAEACTHVPASEDIGTVKIPKLLRKIAPEIKIDFCHGTDFNLQTADLKKYDLIIHCGACMFNRSYMLARQAQAQKQNIPMTNYGLAIAELTNTKTD